MRVISSANRNRFHTLATLAKNQPHRELPTFALPSIGLRWSPYTAALTAMVVNLGAYAAEIVRAGIESIPKGQIEAGRALNLTPAEILRFVILKPALKAIDSALTSQFILLMLSSAVVSVISADDLTSVAANLQSQIFRSFEIYLVVAVIYIVLTLLFSARHGAWHECKHF
jgi:polar amino acid transport system permease protein